MKDIPVRHLTAPQQSGKNLSDTFSIRNVRDLLDGKELVQDLHRHDYVYILSLNRGSGSHEIDFSPYPIHDKYIFLMRPGQVHSLRLEAGSTGYLMVFKPGFFHGGDKSSTVMLRKAIGWNLCIPDASRFEKLDWILGHIYEEYTNKEDGYEEVIKSGVRIFLIEMIRQREHDQPMMASAQTYSLERLDEFLELLEIHVQKYKEVSYYADKLHLSAYQLNAITKDLLGKTSSEIISEHIILEAKRRLLATSGQVSQIAFQLGYEDASYFIRFFRKHTGYSPEAFRLNFR